MTITPTNPGWVGSLIVGDLVPLKFYTDADAAKYVIDVATFDGVNDDGDLASFTTTFDDSAPYTWTAYIHDGDWAYGNFDRKLAQLTRDNAGLA